MGASLARLKEGDFVWFTCSNPSCTMLFHVNYVDEQWVYLRYSGSNEVSFKAERHTGQMRKFISDSWLEMDGTFKTELEWSS